MLLLPLQPEPSHLDQVLLASCTVVNINNSDQLAGDCSSTAANTRSRHERLCAILSALNLSSCHQNHNSANCLCQFEMHEGVPGASEWNNLESRRDRANEYHQFQSFTSFIEATSSCLLFARLREMTRNEETF